MDVVRRLWRKKFRSLAMGSVPHPWTKLGAAEMWQLVTSSVATNESLEDVLTINPTSLMARLELMTPHVYCPTEHFFVFYRGTTFSERQQSIRHNIEAGPLSPDVVAGNWFIDLNRLLRASEVLAPHGYGVAVVSPDGVSRGREVETTRLIDNVVYSFPHRFRWYHLNVGERPWMAGRSLYDKKKEIGHTSHVEEVVSLISDPRATNAPQNGDNEGVIEHSTNPMSKWIGLDVLIPTAADPVLDRPFSDNALQHPIAQHLFSVLYFRHRYELASLPTLCELCSSLVLRPLLDSLKCPISWGALEEYVGWHLCGRLPPLESVLDGEVAKFGSFVLPLSREHLEQTLRPLAVEFSKASTVAKGRSPMQHPELLTEFYDWLWQRFRSVFEYAEEFNSKFYAASLRRYVDRLHHVERRS